jgi:membrane-associated phospholipid phosphatase
MISKKIFFLSIATLSFTLVSYIYFDQYIALWCHINLSQTHKNLFLLITQFGDSTFYLIGFAITALFLHYYWKLSMWRNRFLFLFAAVAVSGIISDIIKVIAGRYRPSELIERGLYGFDFFHIDRALTSFPSGHTATAFSLAMAVTYIWPRLSVIAWVFAISVGVSRIAITAHYPSDVLGGALTGILSVYLIIYYWNKKPKLAL